MIETNLSRRAVRAQRGARSLGRRAVRAQRGARSLGRRTIVGHFSGLALLAVVSHCSTEGAASNADAADARPRPVEAGPIPPPDPVLCGAAECSEPDDAPLAPRACCLGEGGCGQSSRALDTPCLVPAGPGTVDVSCPSLLLPDGVELQGCCAPAGTCGIFDRFGELGCIGAEALQLEPLSCAFVEGDGCRRVVEVPCDGPEDCSDGLVCCGRLQPDGYDRFGCFSSCRPGTDGKRGTWLEICHPERGCTNPLEVCGQVVGLPDFLARCHPSAEPAPLTGEEIGRVRCGEATCETGQKCCLRDPQPPYCAPLEVPCACIEAAPTGSVDASVDAPISD